MTVYLLSEGDYLKIGYTSRDIHQRVRELQTGSPRALRLIEYIPGAGVDVERQLHAKFAAYSLRHNGEWFHASPEIEEEFRRLREVVDRKARAEAEKHQREVERQRAIDAMSPEAKRKWYIKRGITITVWALIGLSANLWLIDAPEVSHYVMLTAAGAWIGAVFTNNPPKTK